MTNFDFDLQLFAVAISGADAVSTANKQHSYYIKNAGTGASDGWYQGSSTGEALSGTVSASAVVVASYDGSKLIVSGTDEVSSVTISDSDNYTLQAGGTRAIGGTTAGALLTAGDGTVNVYGVDVAFTGTGSFTIKDGAVSAIAGTATVGTSSDMALKVAGLTSASGLKIGGATVAGTDATGTFTYNNSADAFVYEATNTSKGQTIDLSAQTATWSVQGSNQNDAITTGTGAATIYGGAGRDTVTVTDTNNGAYIYAGDDADTVTIGTSATGVYVDLGAGNDTLTVGDALTNSTIVSSDGNNVVTVGTTLKESAVSLGGGADSITVGDKASDSTIYGGAGNDTLVVGGTNTVYGGDGADVFNATIASAIATIEDYSLTDGDVIYLKSGSVAGLATAGTNLMSGTIGNAVTGAGTAIVNVAGAGYYAAQFKDSVGSQYVGWVGADDAATIDASGLANSVVLVGLGNSETGDALIGSAKKDTIYAGANDSVTAGEGNDTIVLSGTKSANTINVNAAAGKDTVTGFTGGYTDGESDAVVIDGLTSTSGLEVSYSAGTTVLKGGSTTLTLSMNAGTSASAAQVLINGQKAAAVAASGTYSVTEDSVPDYFFGAKSAVSYASITDALEVNLGDTEKFHDITTLTGGAGDSTLWGSSSKETIIAGSGATSLTGGAGADSLVGNDSSEDTFFFLAGDGKDTISSFGEYVDGGTNNDLLNTFGNAISKVSRVDSKTVKMTVGGGSSDVVTLVTSQSTHDANAMIQFTDGTNKGIAKIGYASKANTFSYDENATAYLGGSVKDVISIASSNSDDLKIWLDGSQGASYSSIDIIADNGKGDNQLAGDTASQSIQAGSGNDSLWGGAGDAADTLKGGSGNDVFFYGYGEGKDVLQNVGADDLVNLYNVDLSQLTITGGEIGSSAISITTTAGETLTVNKASSAATTTFQLNDGSKWTANYSTKTWEQA